jgi:hypothetical protein
MDEPIRITNNQGLQIWVSAHTPLEVAKQLPSPYTWDQPEIRLLERMPYDITFSNDMPTVYDPHTQLHTFAIMELTWIDAPVNVLGWKYLS